MQMSYDADIWKDSDSIKNKLLSIEIGDTITIKTTFEMGGNQIIEIID